MSDQQRLIPLLKERGGLESRVAKFRVYQDLKKELDYSRSELESSTDEEMSELLQEEIVRVEPALDSCLEELRELFVTDDGMSSRNAIVEIRAGTGGDEAALFAGDLYRMYELFVQSKGWKMETLEGHAGAMGGFKELIVEVKGRDVFKYLRYESGGHRVQRVPETETQGRIHTSAATVAVLPEADAVEVDIREQDLRIDTYRSSGPGGQSVNKTSSAIRITHEPTGLVVSCQDEKSQHKNRAKALKILSSRLYELEMQKKHDERSSERRSQIGSGDRSQRIRTYNFPQNRMTDHRINLTLYSLEKILQGELDGVIQPLMEYDKEQKLQDLGE